MVDMQRLPCPPDHRRPWGSRPQPERSGRLRPDPEARGGDGGVGLRQEQPRLRHVLRGGSAAVRGEPLRLCPAVPGADGEAGPGRPGGHLPGHRDQAAEPLAEPAVHGRHQHRDPRPPPRAVRARRAHVLRRLRGGGPARHRRVGGGAAPGPARGRPAVHRLPLAVGGTPLRRPPRSPAQAAASPGSSRRGGRDGGERPGVPGRTSGPSSSFSSIGWPWTGDIRARLVDSLEIAFAEGAGQAVAVVKDGPTLRFSERFECARCARPFLEPQPRLFSFNNPFGACPGCHGFGNLIEVDLDLVVPDKDKSLGEGAIEPWSKPHYRGQQAELRRFARRRGIPLDRPWARLDESQRRQVLEGDEEFTGVLGFFRWLEAKKYKVQVRAFLSRYRGLPGVPVLQRQPAPAGGASGQGGRQEHRRGLGVQRPRRQALLRRARARRDGENGREQGPLRDRPPARIPRRRGPRLPDAQPPLGHALGRRGPAHRPRHRPRHGPRGHAVRARRALGGSASRATRTA